MYGVRGHVHRENFQMIRFNFCVLMYYFDSDSDYLFNINMYKSHNINKGNKVTILDKFYTCICSGDWTKVIQPLARDHHS